MDNTMSKDTYYVTLGGKKDPRISQVLDMLEDILKRLTEIEVKLVADLKGATEEEQHVIAEALNKDTEALITARKEIEKLAVEGHPSSE